MDSFDVVSPGTLCDQRDCIPVLLVVVGKAVFSLKCPLYWHWCGFVSLYIEVMLLFSLLLEVMPPSCQGPGLRSALYFKLKKPFAVISSIVFECSQFQCCYFSLKLICKLYWMPESVWEWMTRLWMSYWHDFAQPIGVMVFLQPFVANYILFL